MKKYAIILSLLFLYSIVYGQKYNIVKETRPMFYKKQWVDQLDQRVMTLLSKVHYKGKDVNFCIQHIPRYLYAGRPITEDFYTNLYIEKLLPLNEFYSINKKEFIKSDVLISDTKGKLIGFGDARYIYLASRYKENFSANEQYILDKIKELDIEYLFRIDIFPNFPIFALNSKMETYVFDLEMGALCLITIDEFILSHKDYFTEQN